MFATRHAVTVVDKRFSATASARALSLDNPLQRAWRDVHAGPAGRMFECGFNPILTVEARFSR